MGKPASQRKPPAADEPEASDENALAAARLRRRFRKPLDPIGSEVPAVTAKAFEKHGFHAADLLINWRAIVGDTVAAYAVPRKIKWARRPDVIAPADGDNPAQMGRIERTVLQLWVDHGRAHEIPYLKGQILDRINQYFGYRAITDIEPISGAIPRRDHSRPTMTKPAADGARPASRTSERVDPQAAMQAVQIDRLSQALAQMAQARERRLKR